MNRHGTHGLGYIYYLLIITHKLHNLRCRNGEYTNSKDDSATEEGKEREKEKRKHVRHNLFTRGTKGKRPKRKKRTTKNPVNKL